MDSHRPFICSVACRNLTQLLSIFSQNQHRGDFFSHFTNMWKTWGPSTWGWPSVAPYYEFNSPLAIRKILFSEESYISFIGHHQRYTKKRHKSSGKAHSVHIPPLNHRSQDRTLSHTQVKLSLMILNHLTIHNWMGKQPSYATVPLKGLCHHMDNFF
jgi:hypothetical protein